MNQKKFSFIGMGNMGLAILKGLLNQFQEDQMKFYEIDQERVSLVEKETKVMSVDGLEEACSETEYIILAIKPQYFDSVLEEMKGFICENQTVISIAPGYSIHKIETLLRDKCRVVRAMPNTPALVGKGMTGVSLKKEQFKLEELEMINTLFSSFGKAVYVEEDWMDLVVCASGSSPAYMFMFVEALADSVVKYGMPRDMAYEMIAQTMVGCGTMILDTKEHPGVLKDRVCSPKGTTIQGVAALEEFGFRNAVIKATDACMNKCQMMKE